MSRRRLAAALVSAACLVAPLPTAQAADAELPRMDCKTRFTDLSDDAVIPGGIKIPAGDITSLFVRLTADELQAFITVQDLRTVSEMDPYDTAYAWEFQAKIGEKTLTLGAAQAADDPYWTGPLAPTLAYPKANVGSTAADKIAEFTADILHAKNTVVLRVSRAALETKLGAALKPGDKLVNLKALSMHWVASSPRQTDSTNGTNLEWTVGDDSCFGPPPATLSDLKATAVQFSDTSTLSAKLVNEAGTALAGKRVEFTVAGDTRPPVVGTTNAQGIATAKYVASQLTAGTKVLTATFPGDATDGKATIAGTIAIAQEPTAFSALAVAKPSATTRTVTATLLDNDKKPVAGQVVTWYVNGKKVATAKTSSTGKAVLKTAKPTQTVQAKFAAVPGKYLASSSKAVKV